MVFGGKSERRQRRWMPALIYSSVNWWKMNNLVRRNAKSIQQSTSGTSHLTNRPLTPKSEQNRRSDANYFIRWGKESLHTQNSPFWILEPLRIGCLLDMLEKNTDELDERGVAGADKADGGEAKLVWKWLRRSFMVGWIGNRAKLWHSIGWMNAINQRAKALGIFSLVQLKLAGLFWPVVEPWLLFWLLEAQRVIGWSCAI